METVAHATDTVSGHALSPSEAATLAAESMELFSLRDQSVRKVVPIFFHFAHYLEASGTGTATNVSHDNVRRFVQAPADALAPHVPGVATMHARRSAIRLLFRILRGLDVVSHDPTLDVQLPPRSSLPHRPLTDDEVLLCRSVALQTLVETRQPAAWALAEATARTAEIAQIRASHLDLPERKVFISGSSRTLPRWGQLTEWGTRQLERRLRTLDPHRDDPELVYEGTCGGESAHASSCSAIASILARAGLAPEPDVRPVSVAAWAAAAAHSEGAPIEEVARMLGVRSLDRAARLIAWDWTKAE